MAEKCQRIAENSLDEDNQKVYKARATEHTKIADETGEKITDESVEKSDKSGIINIEIDEFVPCLKNNKTGEIVQTEVRNISEHNLSKYKESNGWNVDWAKRPKDEYVLGVFVKEETEPQGLVSLRQDRGGIYLAFASTAPHNNKLLNNGNQQYTGVGGHLFAAAIEESVKAGNMDGCIFGYAANEKLLKHYVEKLGAEHLPIAHKYQFIIDGEAAQKILKIYNFDRR